MAYIFQQYGNKHGGRYACRNRRYGGCRNEWQCDSLFASARHNECLGTLDASSGAGRQTGAGLVLYFIFESLDDLVELSASLLAQLHQVPRRHDDSNLIVGPQSEEEEVVCT